MEKHNNNSIFVKGVFFSLKFVSFWYTLQNNIQKYRKYLYWYCIFKFNIIFRKFYCSSSYIYKRSNCYNLRSYRSTLYILVKNCGNEIKSTHKITMKYSSVGIHIISMKFCFIQQVALRIFATHKLNKNTFFLWW